MERLHRIIEGFIISKSMEAMASHFASLEAGGETSRWQLVR
jgi:hypothetical protein